MAPTEVLAEQHASALRGMLDGVDLASEDTLFGRPPAGGGPAHQPHARRRAASDRRRSGRRIHRPGRRHPRPHPGHGRVRRPRCGGDRRTAPLRRGAACRTAGSQRRRHRARRAGDDRHSDSAHRGHDRVRGSRRDGPRRAASGSPADPHPGGALRRRGGLQPGSWCATQVAAGHRAYVVCPLIEGSERVEAASAEEVYEDLATGELADLSPWDCCTGG